MLILLGNSINCAWTLSLRPSPIRNPALRPLLWLCRRRGRSAGFRIGEGRSERVHAQLIDFPSKLSQELIGFESAAGRGCRRLVLCGRGRLGRLLIVGGNQLFLLEHEFVLLFPFEFGLGRLGRLRRSFLGGLFLGFASSSFRRGFV